MKIRIKSFSEPHLWYADKIGQVFDVKTSYLEKFFEIEEGFNVKHVLWQDAEVVEVKTIKINGYWGFVRGDDIFTENSVHQVVKSPNGFDKNGGRGYWINGSNNQPILILHGEYIIEEYYVV